MISAHAKGHDGNEHNYKQHAIFGAALVLEEGFDPRIADAIRPHVLMGLSKKEIEEGHFGIPDIDALAKKYGHPIRT
jgi:hypothetical protein